ncbi:hypothetical protein [Bifidobacterium aerophilum]|uniref:CTP synthase n=1 Tax=Bifidobacterium aerophilum TaxID=1798155 RepID=A0A6N9Z2U5_9BIFI|nr:hypothetical protein [Bifidobacterium aerophilum]NEG88644.1 hypothetical protein [Bifidobacterium aerophilum]
MRRHAQVERMLADAERTRRCAFGGNKALRSAFERRAAAGVLARVFPNMYVDPQYWAALDPPDRTLHIVRTLHERHPQWVFAGLVAATVHGFEHQWSLHDGGVSIVSSDENTASSLARVRRLYAPGCPAEIVDGLPVTGKPRTVVDCCMLFDFRFALPIMDSALRQGVTKRDIIATCGRLRADCTDALRALHYADVNSENGGESLMRGTIIEAGLMVPQTQVVFADPVSGKRYRADFAWRLDDGEIVVAEFDGARKYVDPAMTDGRSIHGVVQEEREREAALMRAGVTRIVRCTFDDVILVDALICKLRSAGVPMR